VVGGAIITVDLRDGNSHSTYMQWMVDYGVVDISWQFAGDATCDSVGATTSRRRSSPRRRCRRPRRAPASTRTGRGRRAPGW
jgi:hypothetical protein